MIFSKKLIKDQVYKKAKSSLNERLVYTKFINEFMYKKDDKESEQLEIPNTVIIKSLDGRDLRAVENIIDDKADYVLLINDNNKPIDDLTSIEKAFNNEGLNTIKLLINSGIKNYLKGYLDIIVWINHYKESHCDKKIYLYGIGLGANLLSIVLKTDVSNLVNAIVLDKIKTNYLSEYVKTYFNKNNLEVNENKINKIKKTLTKKYKLDLDLLNDVKTNIQNNPVPIIFICDLDKDSNEYQNFLSIYNSTKGNKKILYANNSNVNDDLKKVIVQLKKYC